MAEGYVLSQADVDTLREVVDWFRGDIGAAPNRPAVVPEDPMAPEVYIAVAPETGIPALVDASGTGTLETGTGTTTLDVAGSADCYIYQLIDGSLTPVVGLRKTVYNLSNAEIPRFTRLIIQRDKFGKWIVLCTLDTQCINVWIDCVSGSPVTRKIRVPVGPACP